MTDYGRADTLRMLPAFSMTLRDYERFKREMGRRGYASEKAYLRALVLEALAVADEKNSARQAAT